MNAKTNVFLAQIRQEAQCTEIWCFSYGSFQYHNTPEKNIPAIKSLVNFQRNFLL